MSKVGQPLLHRNVERLFHFRGWSALREAAALNFVMPVVA